MALDAPTVRAPDRAQRTLSWFVVPLGLAGLGGVWQTLHVLPTAAPVWPAETLYTLATLCWVGVTLRYGWLRRHDPGGFGDDRRHPGSGPSTAYIPVVGILLASHWVLHARVAGRVVIVVLVVALGVLVAQLMAHWLQGNLPVRAVHPGYLLPTAAGSFIASIGLASAGWGAAAQAAFGVGIFSWAVFGTLVFSRLFGGGPLPTAVAPSLSVLVSPPATGSIAWSLITGGTRGLEITHALLGILVTMVAVQLFLVRGYRSLPVRVNWWVFTFPVSATLNATVRWLAADHVPHAVGVSWLAGGVASAFVLTIAVTTGIATGRRHHDLRGHRRHATEHRPSTA